MDERLKTIKKGYQKSFRYRRKQIRNKWLETEQKTFQQLKESFKLPQALFVVGSLRYATVLIEFHQIDEAKRYLMPLYRYFNTTKSNPLIVQSVNSDNSLSIFDFVLYVIRSSLVDIDSSFSCR